MLAAAALFTPGGVLFTEAKLQHSSVEERPTQVRRTCMTSTSLPDESDPPSDGFQLPTCAHVTTCGLSNAELNTNRIEVNTVKLTYHNCKYQDDHISRQSLRVMVGHGKRRAWQG